MKKIIVSVLSFTYFFLPSLSHAMFMIPSADITIIKNTVGEDGLFSFELIKFYGVYGQHYDSFDLQTQNLSASKNTYLDLWGNNRFLLREQVPVGWSLASVNCTSDLPGNVFNYYGDYVAISAVNKSHITCTFTNTKTPQKNPVLIVPGVLGTNISNSQGKLWLDLGRMFTDIGDEFMNPLQFGSNLLPTDNDLNIGDLVKREIINTGLGKITVFDYAYGLIEELKSSGYTENKDLFTFPYDWRYGVGATNVAALKQKIQNIVAQTGAQKVDVIAHSTGGLLVKKYVMDNPNDHRIGKAVFVGVPNTGAPKAVKVLTEGDNFGVIGLSDAEMKKISENLPVVYDLLPSQKYWSDNGSFIRVISQGTFGQKTEDLDYAGARNFLLTDHALNSAAYDNAQVLHADSFDTYDLRAVGVNLYNIVGCKTGTLGKFTENRLSDGTSVASATYLPSPVSGDGTIPTGSAAALPADPSHVFYIIAPDHGKMLSANGTRQEIVNLVAGTNLATTSAVISGADVATNPSRCAITGRWFGIFSPVAIEIVDAAGNRAGVAADQSIQNDIPGAEYEIMGDHKFVFVPTDLGQTYTVNLTGTGSGTFTLKSSDIENGQISQTKVFSDIPVTAALRGEVSSGGGETLLALDTNGDGAIEETRTPSSTLSRTQSEDLVSPVTTITATGQAGQPGFYRSDVTLSLSATDPVITGHETETSGLAKILYQLDNADFQLCPSTQSESVCAITVSDEGNHAVSFYSEDNAGNREFPKTLAFTIDKTAPEFVIKFSPEAKDLTFSGTDAVSKGDDVTITDNDDIVTAADQAGNTTELLLKDKDRKHKLSAEIKSLRYNGTPADVSKNKLQFAWLFDKAGNLKLLTQSVQSKKDFKISADYALGKTKLEGRDQTGTFKKVLPGLALINISTDRGDLAWGY